MMSSSDRLQNKRLGAPQTNLYLVAPLSLKSWFWHFIDLQAADRVIFIGEEEVISSDLLEELLQPNGTKYDIVLYSSHDTLLRDYAIGAQLRACGHNMLWHTYRSSQFGNDKVLMKRFFDRHQFPTLEWGVGSVPTRLLPSSQSEHCIVIKDRHGTQNRNMLLMSNDGSPPSKGQYWERFVEGVEYSVVAFIDHHREVVFPPVWKGVSTLKLTPPWLRLRLCPNPFLTPDLEEHLRSLTLAIARASGVLGFMEAEYIVTEPDRLFVLEINPRVVGTMRISAMATGIQIFSIHNSRLQGNLRAIRSAAEIPYEGRSFACPQESMFATSRLTVSAPDTIALQRRLESFCNLSLKPLNSPEVLFEWSAHVDRLRASSNRTQL